MVSHRQDSQPRSVCVEVQGQSWKQKPVPMAPTAPRSALINAMEKREA